MMHGYDGLVEADESTFIRCVWFGGDDQLILFASMSRVRPLPGERDGHWRLAVQVRIVLDDKAFDSKDERVRFASDAPLGATEEYALQTFQLALQNAVRDLKIRGALERIEVNGGSVELFAALKDKPWAHIQKRPAGPRA